MFKLRAGKYRLQVERDAPGRLFVQVINREYGRMVWNQLPPDSHLGECVRNALQVIDGLRGAKTSSGKVEKIIAKATERMAIACRPRRGEVSGG